MGTTIVAWHRSDAMASITTEDLVLRLRELLTEQQQQQTDPQKTVLIESRATSELWNTAAAAAAFTPAMNSSNFITTRPAAVGQNSSISQAILSVLQGIRPRQQNGSRTTQV